MSEYKTSAVDLRTFSRAVKRWVKKFGLERWSIFIQHKDDEDDPDGDAAWIILDYESLVATISLAETWPIPVDKESLIKAAFHECLHLVFAPMMDLMPPRFKKPAAQEEHRIIVAMERLTFGKALSEQGVVEK